MAVHYSSESTVQLPRLFASLAVVVGAAIAASFAISGASLAILLPAAVVSGMGLYFQGARRYEVLDDRIRIVGIIGQRDVLLARIRGLVDETPGSLGAQLGSLINGGRLSSAIKVDAGAGAFSGQTYLWLEDRAAFLQAVHALMDTPATIQQA
jgi:hypothetical protein